MSTFVRLANNISSLFKRLRRKKLDQNKENAW